jgi:alpha-D-glucose phosphate-specific phosphoglucomutase
MASQIKFGTDGWRAVIAEAYTYDNVRDVANALAQHLLKNEKTRVDNGVAIGYDTRFMSRDFAQTVAQVLAQSGIPVLLSGRDAATPAIAWATKSRNLAAGIMITASHNPPQWNGFKFFLPQGRGADTEATASVESFLGKKPRASTRAAATVSDFDPIPDFRAQLRNIIDFDLLKKARGKVVCDFVHGVGRGLLDDVLRECNWRVTTLRENPDPMFGGILPDPANPQCHAALQELVLAKKADLGLANDPDADRFGAVDSTGTYITPNQVLALIYVHLLEHRGMKGNIARTVATTHLLDAIAAKHGQSVKETPVGFKWIGEAIDSGEAMFGGEESGGLSIENHSPNKDGVLADLLIAEVWAANREPLTQRYEKIMKQYGTFYSSRIDLHVDVERKDELMGNLRDHPPTSFAGVGVANVVTLDGVKLVLEDGSWLLMRPSGTEPLVRVYFEARRKNRLKEMAKAANELSSAK